MRLQLLDESVRFSCGSCTACCDQPWRTLIEYDKAQNLERHDFSRYPQLAGQTFYHPSSDGRTDVLELAKGAGTRCLFLDTDSLCIIHKELGPEAKPHMCQQFPFLPARTWTDDRVSANFGCPAVQRRSGTRLPEQASDIAAVVPVSTRPTRSDGETFLDQSCKLSPEATEVLFDHALSILGDDRAADVWQCFAELLALLTATRDTWQAHAKREKDNMVQSGSIGEVPVIRAYASPAAAPMPVRMLFAATLYPDTVPADVASRTGFMRRLAMIPKLLSLAQLSGTYPSRLLGRNVSIQDVMGHEVAPALEPAATHLLLRYYRSRFWQRMIAGTRLPVIAGVHQHIHDLNAIIFLARAEARASGETQLTEPLIRQSLTLVEFHLANQSRLYEQTLRGWLRSRLSDSVLALQSLRLMALRPAPEPAETTDSSDRSTPV
ncbi:MAG: YkgJ family cysteine cluster protein [Phycisphaerae bacterium]